jgi:hypothetical protein
MIIRKYNESYRTTSDDVYFVIIYTNDDYFENESVSSICSFPNEMMAADYVIKHTNYFCQTNFEPFYEQNQRLFSNIDENEDYDNCLFYLKEKDRKVIIRQGKSYHGPKHLKEI